MNFYIFRHSETFFSKNNIPYGDKYKSEEILAEGIPSTEKLANYLKTIPTDVNFTSPLIRCIQTTEIIEKISGKKFVKEEKISEELVTKNLESLDIFKNRLKSFLEECDKFNNIALCSHGWPIKGIISLITKGDFTFEELRDYPKCGILVTINNKNINYLNFNTYKS